MVWAAARTHLATRRNMDDGFSHHQVVSPPDEHQHDRDRAQSWPSLLSLSLSVNITNVANGPVIAEREGRE